MPRGRTAARDPLRGKNLGGRPYRHHRRRRDSRPRRCSRKCRAERRQVGGLELGGVVGEQRLQVVDAAPRPQGAGLDGGDVGRFRIRAAHAGVEVARRCSSIDERHGTHDRMRLGIVGRRLPGREGRVVVRDDRLLPRGLGRVQGVVVARVLGPGGRCRIVDVEVNRAVFPHVADVRRCRPGVGMIGPGLDLGEAVQIIRIVPEDRGRDIRGRADPGQLQRPRAVAGGPADRVGVDVPLRALAQAGRVVGP
jgi:hypothetical protein